METRRWRVARLARRALGQNLTQPDMGFQAAERIPFKGRLGLAYQSSARPWLIPALDVTTQAGVLGVNAGLESWFFHEALGLRAGANRDEGTAGISYYVKAGKRGGFRLDYSFAAPFYVEGTSGSHRMQLTVYF